MPLSVEEIAALRAKHRIPAWYDRGLEMKDGSIFFSLMDSSITVHPDGTCTETHMGLNTSSGHYFHTSPWPFKCFNVYRDGPVTRECQRHAGHDGLCDVVEPSLDNGSPTVV